MLYFLCLFIFIIANEAIVELVSKSVFFSGIRSFFSSFKNKILLFIGRVLECPYCCSVWTSLFLTCVLFIFTDVRFLGYVGMFIFFILVHKGSNVFHDISDRYFVKSITK